MKKNSDLFLNTAKTAIIGYEKVMCYSGIDINGVSEELLKDENFLYDLKMISAEIDLSKYINPKSSAFIKLLQKSYSKYEENKIIKNVEKKLDDKNLLDKLKNIK